ncbi:MAG: hypothetical protein OXH49_16225 [Gemmatimonadetes bacterium]|nr:hypothetical protein [Gemmatimonadota bacterium]
MGFKRERESSQETPGCERQRYRAGLEQVYACWRGTLARGCRNPVAPIRRSDGRGLTR